MNKKITASVICAAMLLSAMAGCSSSGSSEAASSQGSSSVAASSGASGSVASQAEDGNLSAPGEFPIVKETVNLKVVTPDATYLTDLNDNEFTSWYEEKTNVKVEYISVPATSKKEKINLLLASGEYPDIIMNCGITTADEVTYGAQGIFLALNDLIERQGYYTKQVFEEQSTLPGAITAPDGNIYALPNINAAFHTFYQFKAWINTDWLDALGLSTPTTTDEFYNVLKAFKEQDPNGNGIADEIPMSGCYKNGDTTLSPYTFLMNSFVYLDTKTSNYLELNDGTVNFVANTDAYKEGIKYIHRLIADGLLDPTSLTQTEEQYKQLGTNPDAQLIGVGPTYMWWKFLGYAEDTADARANNYECLAPLKGPDGVQYSPITGTGVGNSMLVITNKCENPEVAFKWADGLYSQEVTMRSQFGVEGYNWEFSQEGALGIDQKPAIWKQLALWEDGADRNSARNTFMGNRTSELRLGQETDYSDPNAIWSQEPRLYAVTAKYYEPYGVLEKMVPSSLYYTAEESSEYTRLKEQIDTYTTESLVAFLTGNRDVDKEWDSYVAEFEKLSLSKYLEYVQTAYDRQYK